MKKRIAINGFGRIGRLLVKTWYKYHKDHFDIVAINAGGKTGILTPEEVKYFLYVDSNYGHFPGKIEYHENYKDSIFIDGNQIKILGENKPENLPWKSLNIDYVFEATGAFKTTVKANKHIEAGAKRVLITAPPSDDTKMIIMGLNEDTFDPDKHYIISMASCTTNAISIPVYLLLKEFGIITGAIATTHAYTNDQKLTDSKHSKDLRRARSAVQNIIPTTTGATKTLEKIIPELAGKLTGLSFRVPTATVSVVDVILNLNSDVDRSQINTLLVQKILNPKSRIHNYFGISSEPFVSTDYLGNPKSGIVDLPLTESIPAGNNKSLAQIVIWYDNEWGYSSKITDLMDYIAKHDK